MMQSVLHTPRVAPQNSYDWRVLLVYYLALIPVVGLAALAWCGLPALLALQLFGSTTIAALVALTMDIIWIAYFSRMVFKTVTTDATGITFHRLLGAPVFVAWDDVTSIEPVDRETLIKEAWLRFPPPLQSHSVGATGQYRIRWKGGVAYFPPSDLDAWERELRLGQNRLSGPWYSTRPTGTPAAELRNRQGWS